MPKILYAQDDGLFSLYTTVSDGFILVNATEAEVTDYFVEAAIEEARRAAARSIERARDPHPGRTTLAEQIEWVREIHGDEYADSIIEQLRS